MSEIINLAKDKPDTYVYQQAAEILCDTLEEDYSFVIQLWDHEKPKETKYPKVLISTSDEKHNVPVEAQDESYVHIFKQYAPMYDMKNATSVRREWDYRVSPLPLCSLEGFSPQPINIHERTYDWSWMGQFDPYARVAFRNSVNDLKTNPITGQAREHTCKILWYEGWNNGGPIEEYANVMSNTKIALVPNGSASLESFRFFEAAMAGCVIVSQQMPVVPMYNVAPTITVDNNWTNLPDVIDMILDNREEMEYYSHASKAWYEYFCSPEGLADYMKKRLV